MAVRSKGREGEEGMVVVCDWVTVGERLMSDGNECRTGDGRYN